uniref:3-ketoacyl-CoA synthase n=1 Tax=Fibrocapsa japonica TaxID=94617 RepID=A0A7S2XYV1_9STRA|mmetsp:Transcript_23803/g.34626  ORF Transcript_23803/g.34626 Transcript_23803/m.34626 type:complete len:533 (+) Transcript_23803:96-1694(+)|eukprot:CAMPEP_0113935770 /NCGR_PEP_ID=MMETSP1339-20121228/2850_1 /TAXON_ID=94617 /ORGANISM="Fibrocapsa japonica" /LENGTH=532 /DNA_ID=CAMNT_0000938029 /DNA_START=59 /DNA_END=1657 /DNA_ORIENTATION=+ /assembly_acc=CAM_ASM_000762
MGEMTEKAAEDPALSLRRNDSASDLSEFETTRASEYKTNKSKLMKLINWWHVSSTYFPFIFAGFILYMLYLVIQTVVSQQAEVKELATAVESSSNLMFDLGWKLALLLGLLIAFLSRRKATTYLVDFSCFEPPNDWKVTHEELRTLMLAQKCFTEDSVGFMDKILARSGTGQATAWPPGIIQSLKTGEPMDRSVEAARDESDFVICSVVKDLLDKTGVKPKAIDFLVINCSLFSPTPSLCSMVIHKFGMRPGIISYNLSGMGCSAGVIAIDLAKRLMESRPHSTALVVSTENLTQNLYHGNERSMLLQNTLFRCGGAAILLTNKPSAGFKAKYKLLCTVRTQGIGEDAYEAVYECEDKDGHHGVKLSKDIVMVAGRTMEKNFTTLGPLVLPLSEQAKVVWAIVLRKATQWIKRNLSKGVNVTKNYVPDFKRGIDHFCIHAGGRAVIDGVEKNLKLQPYHTEPSRATLRDYGNTSSSSIWYEMKYVEEHQVLKRGQRLLQIAFGSGFKCNSAVWLSLHPPRQTANGNGKPKEE